MNSQIAISGECYGITSLRNHRRFDRSCRIFLCHVFATKTNKYFQRQAETTLGRPHTRKWFNNPLLATASPYPLRLALSSNRYPAFFLRIFWYLHHYRFSACRWNSGALLSPSGDTHHHITRTTSSLSLSSLNPAAARDFFMRPKS